MGGGTNWQMEVNTGSHSSNPTHRQPWDFGHTASFGHAASLGSALLILILEGCKKRCPKHCISQQNWPVYHDWQCTHTTVKNNRERWFLQHGMFILSLTEKSPWDLKEQPHIAREPVLYNKDITTLNIWDSGEEDQFVNQKEDTHFSGKEKQRMRAEFTG